MISNDASDDGHAHAQAESDAPRLGGEVGLHNLVDDSRINARAVVVDGDAHALGRGTHSDADEGFILAASRKLGHAARGLGSRDQVGVLILDSLSSVDDEVRPHLLQLRRVRAHGRHILVVAVDADAPHPVSGQPQDVVDALAHVHGLEVLGVRARVALQGLGQLDDAIARGEHRAQGSTQARAGLVRVDATRDLRERPRAVRPLDPRAHEAPGERAVADDGQELLHEGALDRGGARGRGEGAGHRLPRRGRGRCRERRIHVLVQVLGSAHEGGHRVVELVSDAGAQLAEHREARAFDQLGAGGAQVLEGGGQGLLLGLEILGEHRVLQVEVLGAHEATRQRADRERRQRRTDRRILGDNDLELLGRQAHERRLGRRLAREERVLRAGQRHEADERARRRQVRQDLALRRIPVQRHLAIQH